MSSFTGGSPQTSFNNDELYRLGQAIAQATVAPVPSPSPQPAPSPSPVPAGVTVHDIPWRSGRYPSGAFGADEIIAFRFTVPAGFAANGAGHFGGGPDTQQTSEYPNRKSALSNTAGAFTPLAPGALIDSSNTVYLPFYVAPVYDGYYASLQPGQTYYVNVRNLDLPAGTNGAMYLDLTIPH